MWDSASYVFTLTVLVSPSALCASNESFTSPVAGSFTAVLVPPSLRLPVNTTLSAPSPPNTFTVLMPVVFKPTDMSIAAVSAPPPK